jgi:predicted amidohydrolase YtcJ
MGGAAERRQNLSKVRTQKMKKLIDLHNRVFLPGVSDQHDCYKNYKAERTEMQNMQF